MKRFGYGRRHGHPDQVVSALRRLQHLGQPSFHWMLVSTWIVSIEYADLKDLAAISASEPVVGRTLVPGLKGTHFD
jgi:hypothetical protein